MIPSPSSSSAVGCSSLAASPILKPPSVTSVWSAGHWAASLKHLKGLFNPTHSPRRAVITASSLPDKPTRPEPTNSGQGKTLFQTNTFNYAINSFTKWTYIAGTGWLQSRDKPKSLWFHLCDYLARRRSQSSPSSPVHAWILRNEENVKLITKLSLKLTLAHTYREVLPGLQGRQEIQTKT